MKKERGKGGVSCRPPGKVLLRTDEFSPGSHELEEAWEGSEQDPDAHGVREDVDALEAGGVEASDDVHVSLKKRSAART